MLSSPGCDVIYRLLHKQGAQEKKLLGEVLPFESHPQIAEVQKYLKLFGYNPGNDDGKLGLNTRNAVARFQTDHQLPATRFIDQATWDHLHVLEGSGLVKKGEVDISLLQTALQKAGCATGVIDGKPGPQTQRALIKFQSAQGLKPDGIIGFKTLQALEKFLN